MPSDGDKPDLVNCHFSVNSQALSQMVRPLFGEVMHEYGLEQRLFALETTLSRVQENLDLKTDLRGFQAAATEINEQKQLLTQKASQATVAATQAQLRSLEATVGWKADQSAVAELSAETEKLSKLISAKTDAAVLNKLTSALQRVQQQASQNEKLIQDLTGRLQKLEVHNLPQTAVRMAEQAKTTKLMIRQVQDAVATKAEQTSIEVLSQNLKDIEATLGLKVPSSSLQELKAQIRDLELKIDLKVDAPAFEEQRRELHRTLQLVNRKADSQELRETAASLHAIRSDLDCKLESQTFSDLRHRVQGLEEIVEHKANHKDLADVISLRDSIAQKADRRTVVELSTSVERLQREFGLKAELAARTTAKREIETRTEKLEELGRNMQTALETFSLSRSGTEASLQQVSSTVVPQSPIQSDVTSPRKRETDVPIPEEIVGRRIEILDCRVRTALSMLDSKPDRAEIEERLFATATEVSQRRKATEALSTRVDGLDNILESAIKTLAQKADRTEIQELLSAAASEAVADINEHDVSVADVPRTATKVPPTKQCDLLSRGKNPLADDTPISATSISDFLASVLTSNIDASKPIDEPQDVNKATNTKESSEKGPLPLATVSRASSKSALSSCSFGGTSSTQNLRARSAGRDGHVSAYPAKGYRLSQMSR